MGKISPPADQSKGVMELVVTRAQLEAVQNAKHLPENLRCVLTAARPTGDGYTVTLTYEDATALNELCAWNVHTDANGGVTAESRLFDDLIRTILKHPEY